jgi:mono/diheme cytochrome c family protein
MKRILMLLAAIVLIYFSVPTSYVLPAEQPGKDAVGQGRKLFMTYCASCHGINGAGDGPVAASLKKHPPDLRRLQANNTKFSSDRIRKSIIGDPSLPVHGDKEMPVWGWILTGSDITNLVRYIESIQKPFDPQPAD